MRKAVVFLGVLILVSSERVFANSPPVVSNVTASQRTECSMQVDIQYDLADADGDNCRVSVLVSDDGGSTWSVAAASFTGDIGTNIAPGAGKQIIWETGTDLPGAYGTNYRVKVTADDGPTGMAWVYIDDDGSEMRDANGDPISHGGFTGYMGKYEITNKQYCQFLNAALASGDIVYDALYIATVYGNSGPYDGQIYMRTSLQDCQISYSDANGLFYVESHDGYDMSDYPVVDSTWYGAMAFADYYGWRLPTEWEWHAVADYDGSYTFPCGTTIDQSKANYYEENYANPTGFITPPYTSPVDYYPPCGYGLNSMTGNVYEYTSSCFYEGCSPDDISTRGGGWTLGWQNCRVWERWPLVRTYDSGWVGFRVCR